VWSQFLTSLPLGFTWHCPKRIFSHRSSQILTDKTGRQTPDLGIFIVQAGCTKFSFSSHPCYPYYYPSLSCFLGKIIRAIYPQLAQNLPLTNRRSREKFFHHEGTKIHEEKRERGVAGSRRSFNHSWHACFLMCCTRRRKEQTRLDPALIAGGEHSRRTLHFLFLLRALRGLRGEALGCGKRLR
jgi:hypothetical protein